MHIAGAGIEEESLRDLVNELNLGDVIEFVGYQTNVLEFLQSLDIFAMTSDNEGFPYAQLEAMSVGLPSVCYVSRRFTVNGS